MRGILGRFVMLIATAAVLPLVIFGAISIGWLRMGTRRSVVEGNERVAVQAARQIEDYILNNVRILQAAGADLQQTRLLPWQQDRILKNYVIEFPEFREITLFDPQGTVVATSRVGTPRTKPPAPDAIPKGQTFSISPLVFDDDFLPTTTVAIRLQRFDQDTGWLVAELNLEQLWRMVDSIRVGRKGFALIVTRGGQLIAHGNPDEKPRIARGDNLLTHPVMQQIWAAGRTETVEAQYPDRRGRTMLAVGTAVRPLDWTLIIEQPTEEAYALAIQLERQLLVVIALALLASIAAGIAFGRSFIRPIFELVRATRAIAEGRWEERARIASRDEFGRLGEAFNQMAEKLVELRENMRKQERQAMFGRVAAGLVHDLSHPIQNIANSCKLIVKMFDDYEYRETFKRTVDREFATIKRVLDDLRHLARPAPIERFPIDVNRAVAETVEAMKPPADTAGVALTAHLAPGPLYIQGDFFALGRVFRNLVLNAIQATAPGGSTTLTTSEADGRVRVTVEDTGCGIPPERLGAIFDDFVTTKRRGLGLGLAISKKIVEQLDGTISVTSEVGKGTTFVLEFPKSEARPAEAQAAINGKVLGA